MGLSPDVLICRSTDELDESTKRKLGVFCHVSPDHVLSVHDVSNIYHVPLILVAQNVHTILRERLVIKTDATKLPAPPAAPHKPLAKADEPLIAPSARAEPDLKAWTEMAHAVDNFDVEVHIALVGAERAPAARQFSREALTQLALSRQIHGPAGFVSLSAQGAQTCFHRGAPSPRDSLGRVVRPRARA